jgi:hypothetical protein
VSSVANILKFPIHFAQLFSGAKSFEDNSLLGNKFLNKKGLHVWRVARALKLAEKRRKRLAHLVSAEHRVAYERDGYVKVENFLDEDTFFQVLNEIRNTTFDRFDMRQGSAITRRSLIDEADLVDKPGLRKAKNDPRMLNLVRYVASHHGQPLITLQTVLALPTITKEAVADPQTQIHSDTFHSTAKAWLFLTDVGEDDGPFSYVAGSHKVTEERYDWEKNISMSHDGMENKYAKRGSLRVDDTAHLGTMGYSLPTKMSVKANTLVVADTHGFHARCASDKPTTRIGIYSSLRRNPFIPLTGVSMGGLHLASIPLIRNRLNILVTQRLMVLQKLGVRQSPWKDIGTGMTDEWPSDFNGP